MIRVTLTVTTDASGALRGEVVELPGCVCAGATMRDLVEAADRAVHEHLREHGLDGRDLEVPGASGPGPRVLTVSIERRTS